MKRRAGLPRYAAALSAGVVAILVYANSLANGFAYDDDWIIGGRELVHGLGNVWAVVTAPYWTESFASPIYRPLTLLSFAIDWQIWGGQPVGFHLVNVLLHALVTVLIVIFLSRFFPRWAAWAGGLVFAVHSVHTEAVANVVGRAELLTAVFVITGCLIYMKAVRGGRVGAGAIALLAISYALAGFSKEVGFVMPALLLATDLPLLARMPRNEIRRFVRLRLPSYAVLAGVLFLLFLARWAVLGAPVGSAVARVFALDDSFATRFFTMARVWPRYFELILFPLQLSADYSPAVILPVSGLTPTGVLGLLTVIGVAGLAFAVYRRVPELTMALAWAAVTLLPVSNLLFTAETVLGERRLYLTSVALSIVVALMLARASGARRRWLAVVVGAWVVVFSVVTVRRNPVWNSTDTVFADLLRTHPESSRVLFGLGLRHHELGHYEDAREWLRRSLAVWPWYAPYHAKYAMVLIEQGELAEAAEQARTATELEPDVLDYHKLLALVFLMDEKPGAALAAIERALELAEPDASLYTQQADAYAGVGDFGAAARAQEAAIEAGREDWTAWLRLARFRAAAGDTVRAREALRAARQAPGADPAHVDSLERAW